MRKGWKKRLAKTTAKLPRDMEHMATTKWSAKKQKKFQARKLGSFGAASEVRVIKPEET